jgi:predicted outer membrane protein
MLRHDHVWYAGLIAVSLTAGAMAEQAPQSTAQQGAQQAAQQAGQQAQPAADQAGQQAQQAGAQMGDSDMKEAVSANVDRAFAAVAISHFRLQREISQLVAQKATNPQIKQLAQDANDDYERFSQRIQQAAQKQGVTLHPHRLLPRDQAVLDFIAQLPADALERNYVFHQAGSNQTHQLYAQWVANNAQNADIKQVAQEIASRLQQRGQTIQQLAQAEVGAAGGAQPAGGQVAPAQDQK